MERLLCTAGWFRNGSGSCVSAAQEQAQRGSYLHIQHDLADPTFFPRVLVAVIGYIHARSFNDFALYVSVTFRHLYLGHSATSYPKKALSANVCVIPGENAGVDGGRVQRPFSGSCEAGAVTFWRVGNGVAGAV